MPSFRYKAKREDASTTSGQVIAANREEAIDKINQMRLVPIQVEEITPGGGSGNRGGLGSIKARHVCQFTRQLFHLLKGGVSILKALEILAHQQKSPAMRDMLESLHIGIRDGRSFSGCLTAYPGIFPPFYTAMVKAGEESGNLKDIVGDLADYLKGRQEINAKVTNAFMYPALMSVLGLGSVTFILTYVLPKLSVLYKQFHQALPVPTRVVMALSNFFIHHWIEIGLVLLIGWLSAYRFCRSPQGRLKLGQWQLGLPVIGPFLIKVDMMRFCRTLGLLLKSGIPIVRAVQLAVPVVKNEQLRAHLAQCREDLIAGRSFTDSLKEIRLLPETFALIIAIGEESGDLTQVLFDTHENYNLETSEALKTMTTLLEPLLIIVVGSVIGFIVIAMLLPIFQLDMMVS